MIDFTDKQLSALGNLIIYGPIQYGYYNTGPSCFDWLENQGYVHMSPGYIEATEEGEKAYWEYVYSQIEADNHATE